MGKLTIVGLPLGNIEDISLRAFKALFSGDIVIAEDTRNYLKIKSILKERLVKVAADLEINLEARPELISYREENHTKILPKILDLLSGNANAILISDAGMPLISDPGYRLIDELIKHNIEVDVVPSATAVDTALVLSGLPTDRFIFLGFLPREKGKIKKLMAEVGELTAVYYESPYRVIKTLEIIAEDFPEIKVAACNDLTKKFQRIIRGTISEVLAELRTIKVQGEWVVVIS